MNPIILTGRGFGGLNTEVPNLCPSLPQHLCPLMIFLVRLARFDFLKGGDYRVCFV